MVMVNRTFCDYGFYKATSENLTKGDHFCCEWCRFRSIYDYMDYESVCVTYGAWVQTPRYLQLTHFPIRVREMNAYFLVLIVFNTHRYGKSDKETLYVP